jgi:hypothetical protein
VALGITYLLDSEPTASETVYLATSAGGAALGSLLTFNAVRGGDPLSGQSGLRAPPRQNASREGAVRPAPAVSLSFEPAGLLLPLLAPAGVGSHAAPFRSAPILQLRF